jgi:hypothetical protein
MMLSRAWAPHPKHHDFREEPKTERVLWSALAYVPSDKAKKFCEGQRGLSAQRRHA